MNFLQMHNKTTYPNIAFLFDLDGVLIDSEKEYSRIWKTLNKEFPTGVESLEKIIKGTTLEKILDEFFPEPEVQKAVSTRLFEMEQAMKYDYKEGARQLLENLEYENIPRALVTSSNNEKMKHLHQELPDILKRFNLVITGDMITHSKPDPEGYLLAAKKLECNPYNCVVFEDSLQGVKAGKNAGAYVVGVSGTLEADVIYPFSDMVIDSLLEINLDDLIEKLR